MPKEIKEKIIRAWATINCRGDFCGAYWNPVRAKCEKEELDENWDEKGAKVVPCEIKILCPKKKKSKKK